MGKKGIDTPIIIQSVKSKYINFNELQSYVIPYIDNDSLREQKINILINDVLPFMNISMDDLKRHILITELKDMIPISSDETMYEMSQRIKDIHKYMEKVNDEKMTILKIREEFNYLDIDLTDSEIKELYEFIKKF